MDPPSRSPSPSTYLPCGRRVKKEKGAGRRRRRDGSSGRERGALIAAGLEQAEGEGVVHLWREMRRKGAAR